MFVCFFSNVFFVCFHLFICHRGRRRKNIESVKLIGIIILRKKKISVNRPIKNASDNHRSTIRLILIKAEIISVFYLSKCCLNSQLGQVYIESKCISLTQKKTEMNKFFYCFFLVLVSFFSLFSKFLFVWNVCASNKVT